MYIAQIKRIAVVLIAALSLAAATAARASLLDKIQWKTEKHYGNATVQQIGQYYGYIEDAPLSDYVNRMGRSIASVGHRTDINYEFFIVDTDEVNAFAAPGGFVFISRGMLEEAESEDEIAGVIGHEVAHISAKHGAKRIKKLPFILVGMGILASNTDDRTTRIAEYALSLAQLHYSREDEYEADKLGAAYSRDAGYDARSLATMFQKLEKENPSGNLSKLEVALSSHPKTTGRINSLSANPALAETPEERIYRAMGYAARHYYREASGEFRAALSLAPSDARALNGLASALTELGEFDEAERRYQDILANDPEDAAAAHGLERIEELRGSAGAARRSPGFASLPADERHSLSSALTSAADELDKAAGPAAYNFKALASRLDDMQEAFYRDLSSFRTTADKVRSNDRGRSAILEQASNFFGGYLAALDYYKQTGRRLLEAADEMKVNARIAAYKLSRAEESGANAAQAARELERAILRMVSDSDFFLSRVVETAEIAQKGYETTSATMRELDFSLFASEEPIDNFTGSILFNRTVDQLDSLDKSFSSTEKISESIDRSVAGMRRASANLNAALMSETEKGLLLRQVERRFGMKAETMRSLLGKGFGAADAVLIHNMAASASQDPVEFAYGFNPGKDLREDDFFSDETKASGKALLLKLLEDDIKAATGRFPSAHISPEPDPSPRSFLENESGDEALESAAAALEAGEPDKAVEAISERGKKLPATMASHALLAAAHKMRDDSDSAVVELKRALNKRSDIFELRLALGNAFADLERYDDALNEYGAASALAPDRPESFSAKGRAFAMKGDLPRASENFKMAQSLGDSRLETIVNLGLVYYREGRLADALAMFESALELDPTNESLAGMAAALKK
ncbi:MAG TPA: M48 family metalloprotease, partial [bacterium]|nr:M48 family metalloprotease [bacterium]